jgi:hypothetical protein
MSTIEFHLSIRLGFLQSFIELKCDIFQKNEILVRREEVLPNIDYVSSHISIRGLIHPSTLKLEM